MRIGIDVDDTITNTYEYLIERIAEHYNLENELLRGRCLAYSDFYNNSDEFPDYNEFLISNYGKYISNVSIKDGVRDSLNKLHNDKHEIYFITARHDDECDDPYKITADYLLKHQIPFDKIIVGANDKGIICKQEQIDLFIDDSIRNCTSVSSYGINTLIFDAKFNKNEDRFERVYSWKEVYDIVKKHSE